MQEIIKINDVIELQAVDESHVSSLFQLIQKNKAWLQQSMNWPQYVNTEDDTRKTVQGNMMLHQRGYAKMFTIFAHDEMAGAISFNQIEPLNKTAYIGYWLDQSRQGQGIISLSLQGLMQHYAQRGEIRRFVIKCRVANETSNQVAMRNEFAYEGCLKQAEFLNGSYDDINIYGRIIDPSLK